MVARGGEPLVHARFRDLPRLLRARRPARRERVGDAARGAGRAARGRHRARAAPAPTPDPGASRASTTRWVVELRRGGRAASRTRALRRAARAGRRRHGRARRAVPVGAAGCGSPRSTCPRRCSTTSPRTARRSATRTSRGRGRSPTTRRCSRACPAAPRCRAPGRPFTARALRDLRARGVGVAPLVLHTGVSSQERGERPYPERFVVPARHGRARSRRRARPAGG